MKRKLLKAGLCLLAIGAIGFLVLASGVVPITATSGHWPTTEWLFQFAKRRSVALHTIGADAPPLDEPWLVLKGAGHYESGCRFCHGAPGFPRPEIPEAMTPAPPRLAPRIERWEPEELFYIVKHGIKLTGMPAWVSQQRDDEVYAMVAFLQALPDLEQDEYLRLVYGEVAPAGPSPEIEPPGVSQLSSLLPTCARCHGADGLGRGLPAFPKLAGQKFRYLLASLQAFASGTRHSGIMQPVAARLRPAEMRALARYYSSLPAAKAITHEAPSAAAVEHGREIALRGIPLERVPACQACHGPSDEPRNPVYPLLAGQYAEYLVLQLQLFKDERRGGTEYANVMRPAAHRLTPEQMRAVSLYYASLSSPP